MAEGRGQGKDPADPPVPGIVIKLTQLESAIADLRARVEKMERAMYGDNGKQGILSRLAVIEAKIEQLASNSKWSVILAAGTFLGIIVTIISILVRGGGP